MRAGGYAGGPSARPADADAMRAMMLPKDDRAAYVVRLLRDVGALPAGTVVGQSSLGGDCGFERVKIQTDRVNLRSQAAIARLAATREGVLRHHVRRPDGSWRDTVVYSVLREEWPAVRQGLRDRVDVGTHRRA